MWHFLYTTVFLIDLITFLSSLYLYLFVNIATPYESSLFNPFALEMLCLFIIGVISPIFAYDPRATSAQDCGFKLDYFLSRAQRRERMLDQCAGKCMDSLEVCLDDCQSVFESCKAQQCTGKIPNEECHAKCGADMRLCRRSCRSAYSVWVLSLLIHCYIIIFIFPFYVYDIIFYIFH